MPSVVLLKSESDGPDKFAELLQKHDFDVRTIFCLDFEFVNLQKLEEKLRSHEHFNGIIFTSQRAVQAAHRAIEKSPEVLDDWKKKRNYSVGGATSELASNLLHLETAGKESGNAQSLADFMIEQLKDEPERNFLFPSGNLKQDILEKALLQEKIIVESLEAYRTVPHPQLNEKIRELKTDSVNFLVFFSPSGVKFSLPAIVEHKIDIDKVKIIAIGPSTKKSLDENNLECFKMCSKPTPESLLEALT